MQPLACFVGEAFVLYAQQEFQLISDAVEMGMTRTPRKAGSRSHNVAFDAIVCSNESVVAALVESESFVNPYIHHLQISALTFRVTLHFNVPRVHLYLGMDNSRLTAREVVMHNLSLPPGELASNLVKLYTADVIAGSPSLLGSLQILGNPGGLIASVVNGVYDFVGMPMQGVRDMDALGAVVGIGRGSVSFLRHLSVGTLQSFSGCLSAVAKNMDALTMDEAYLLKNIRQRALNSRQGFGASVANGFRGLGSSVVEGVVGLVQQPLAGAQESGVRGFVTGSALGFWNVLVKPLGGAVELVGSVAAGTLNSFGGGPFSEQAGPGRKRRVLLHVADIKWRRRFKEEFVRAFDCKLEGQGACVVVFTKSEVLLVLGDTIASRVERDGLVSSERDGTIFDVPKIGSLAVGRVERREFAKLLKSKA